MQGHFTYAANGARKVAKGVAIAGAVMLASTISTAQDNADGDEHANRPATDVARPSNAEIMANPILRNALSRSTEGLVTTRAPDGHVSVDLQGRFQSVSVARIGADGEIEVACTQTHESLAAFLAAHPQASEDDYDTESGEHRHDQ
jgi:hypothetical protein